MTHHGNASLSNIRDESSVLNGEGSRALDTARGGSAMMAPVSTREFRRACGQFATGVAVVTTRHQGRPVGMTINSFASVSLDPPLILWSLRNNARSRTIFETADGFAVSILSAAQTFLARHFAAGHSDPFDGLDTSRTPSDLPLIPGAIAHLECGRYDVCDGGDHRIVLGIVKSFAIHGGAPLLFHNGKFLANAGGQPAET